jgi:hypothetical protein
MDFHDFQNIHFYPTVFAQSLALEGMSSFLAPELMAIAMARGCRFLEVPIPFIPRKGDLMASRKNKAYRLVARASRSSRPLNNVSNSRSNSSAQGAPKAWSLLSMTRAR